MLRFIYLGAMLGLMSLSAACQKDDRIERTPPPDSAIETPASFSTTVQLPSEVYGGTREINIYVPKIPAWGKGFFDTPLSVLYVVDGGLEQDFFHIAALSNLTLINAERQPMIVVGVKTENRRQEITPDPQDKRYQGGEFKGYGGAEDFRRHLIQEVKPYIDARFNTGRDVIIGESLAGLFIVDTFLRSPNAFDDYVAISPSLWWDNRRLAREAQMLLKDHNAADHRLYLTMANEGGSMRRGLDELLTALEPHEDKAAVKFVDRADSDTHSSIYHHAARDALGWMYGIPEEPYTDEAPWYLKVGEED